MHSLFHSLKFRIIAVAAFAGVLAALGTAKLVLDLSQDEIQTLLLTNDRQDRERTAALLASKLETLKHGLTAVAAVAQPPLGQDRPSMESFLLSQPALLSLFNNVFIVGLDGQLQARIENGIAAKALPNVADRAYFKKLLHSDQPEVSAPLLSKINRIPVIVVAAPILAPDGHTIGVLAGTLSLRSNNLFSEGTGPRDDGVRDLVMDREGTLLSHSEATRVLGKAQDEPGLGAVFVRWTQAGSPIDTLASAEISGDQLVSVAGIPLSDWVVVRLTPRAIALAPLHAGRRAAWIMALGFGLAAALLAGVLAWAIVRPIARLRDSALQLIAGQSVSPGNWPLGSDEIAQMTQAFRKLDEQRESQRAATQGLLRQLQAVLDNAEVGIVLTRNGRFETVSRQFCAIFLYEPITTIGQLSRLMYPSDEAYAVLSARAEPAFLATGTFDGEIELMRSSGELFWASMRGRALVPGDRAQGTIWVITDVTHAYRQRQTLTWSAGHDALTGLANRAAFEALLEEATESAAERPFCALFIDLDKFKQVNDTGGHAAGDALLRGLARDLEAGLRNTDTVARLGGDEFAVLLPLCPLPRAQAIADTLRRAVEDYCLSWEGQIFRVGASIGVVLASGGHTSSAEVMQAADGACYAAKRLGRNRVAAA